MIGYMPVVLIEDHDHGRTYLRCDCGAVFVLDDGPADTTPIVCHLHEREHDRPDATQSVA